MKNTSNKEAELDSLARTAFETLNARHWMGMYGLVLGEDWREHFGSHGDPRLVKRAILLSGRRLKRKEIRSHDEAQIGAQVV